MGTPEDSTELPTVDAVVHFEKIGRVGEGTYGVVYKARDRRTGEIVALKKLRMDRERDGMPVTSVREVRVLQACQHPNLVHLREVVTGSKLDSVFLVFEFVEHDLGRLVDSMVVPFRVAQVKGLLRQLLAAVAFLHDRWIVHRDIKLSNLLLTEGGTLKLCDFGLARYFKPFDSALTPRVVTLWYRAPEVLLGSEMYSEAIDMWALGCVMAELLRNEPLFPARTEVETFQLIMRLLGTPTARIWPGFDDMPNAKSTACPEQPFNYLKKEFPMLSEAGVDLLNQMLTYDPEKRISARAALEHPWLAEAPMPQRPEVPRLPLAPEPRRRHEHRREVDAHIVGRLLNKRGRSADERFGDLFAIGITEKKLRK